MFLGAQPQNGSSLKLFIALQTVETKARLLPVPANDPLKSFSEQVWGFSPSSSHSYLQAKASFSTGLYFANTHDE